MSGFRLSPAWSVRRKDGGVLLTGGDDALFEVEAAGFLDRLAEGAEIERRTIDGEEAALFEKLVAAEIAVPVITAGPTGAIAFVGDELPWELPLPDGLRQVDRPAEADLVVVVRRTSRLWEIAERAAALERLHLYIDLSFHHTVSIGPLVVPHETPCISCLAGRLSERWGESEPPADPGVARSYPRLSAALAVTEIERAVAGDGSLAGWTAWWNLADRTARRERLLTTAACPYCRPWQASGRIEL